MTISVHALVSGKVQGVYFRDHTRRRAQALHLTGWVKNLPDGRVETLASGPRAAVVQFIEWLKEGSPQAQVSEVCWEEVPHQQTSADFIIIRDN